MSMKVWQDSKGKLFHDDCFEAGESREGYNPVKLDDLEEDSECEACGGEFLSGLTPADDDNDDDDGNGDEEKPF